MNSEQNTVVCLSVVLAMDAGVITQAQACKILGMTAEKIEASRKGTIDSVKMMMPALLAARDLQSGKNKAKPVCTPCKPRYGWIDIEGVPLSRVRMVATSSAPCTGCGGAAATFEVLEIEGKGVLKPDPSNTREGLCAKEVIYDDDPANAVKIVDFQLRMRGKTFSN